MAVSSDLLLHLLAGGAQMLAFLPSDTTHFVKNGSRETSLFKNTLGRSEWTEPSS